MTNPAAAVTGGVPLTGMGGAAAYQAAMTAGVDISSPATLVIDQPQAVAPRVGRAAALLHSVQRFGGHVRQHGPSFAFGLLLLKGLREVVRISPAQAQEMDISYEAASSVGNSTSSEWIAPAAIFGVVVLGLLGGVEYLRYQARQKAQGESEQGQGKA